MLRVTDKEEDGWEVAKYFLSDDLVYNSENKKQLSRARREAAAKKKKREASKQKLKKKEARECSSPPRKKSEISSEPHQGYSCISNNSKAYKICFPYGQEWYFQYVCPNRRNWNNNNSNSGWEISDKTGNISVHERLKENSYSWKIELKLSLMVQNITDNGIVVIPFTTIPASFYVSNNRSSLRNSRLIAL